MGEAALRSQIPLVVAAVLPLLKLITITVVGLILSIAQTNSRATFKLLNKLLFVLFLPCLIFTCLGPSVSLHNITLWWFIPVNVIISTFIGCLLGFLVTVICRPRAEFHRFTVIATALGNTGNVPLAVVSSVCRSEANPFSKNCDTNGVAYVSFSQWVSVILLYTLVYHMMEPPAVYHENAGEGEADGDEIQEEEEEEIEPVPNPSTLLLHETGWPLSQTGNEHDKTPFIARVFNSFKMSGDQRDDESLTCLAEPRVVRRIRVVAEQTPIKNILQPQTIASLLAVVIGVIPAVKSFVFDPDSPVAFVAGSLSIVADATVPSVLLILGGMLAETSKGSRLGTRTVVGVTVARLIILPVIGFGVVYLAGKWGLLVEDDGMFRFVLLMQYATPSAILLGAMANLRGYAVKEASALIFWQHICAIFTLLFFFVVYFSFAIHYLP